LKALKTRLVVGLAVASIAAFAIGPAAALAESPDNPSCWGAVTSQRASTLHDVGAHASSEAVPRSGLGNNPFGHVSDLGSFLAVIDGIDATNCP